MAIVTEDMKEMVSTPQCFIGTVSFTIKSLVETAFLHRTFHVAAENESL